MYKIEMLDTLGWEPVSQTKTLAGAKRSVTIRNKCGKQHRYVFDGPALHYYHLEQKTGRPKYTENRTRGIGFSPVTKDGNVFQEVMAMSTCKDYLNDVIWSEHNDKNSTLIYGFKHKPQGLLKDDYFYMSVGNLTSSSRTLATKVDLTNNLKFIHQVEEKLGIEKTEMYDTDAINVIRIDKYWTQYPYLISLYAQLFRESSKHDGRDLSEYPSMLISSNITEKIMKKLRWLFNNEPFDCGILSFDMSMHRYKVHGAGILNTKFPYE